jgi:CO dehydrogenase maturation factor
VKVAIAGKGGSGKTSISGTMARVLARQGKRVLAIDGDSNPNLALTLGLPADAMSSMPTLTRDMLKREPTGTALAVSLEQICETHSVSAPDGVTLLVMANPQHAGTG